MNRKRRAGGAGPPGPGALEGMVQRLLQAAFRPKGASDQFRDQMIRTSLNILHERREAGQRRGGVWQENAPSFGMSNPLDPGASELVRRREGSDRANVLGGDPQEASGAEESSETYQSRGQGRKQRFGR